MQSFRPYAVILHKTDLLLSKIPFNLTLVLSVLTTTSQHYTTMLVKSPIPGFKYNWQQFSSSLAFSGCQVGAILLETVLIRGFNDNFSSDGSQLFFHHFRLSWAICIDSFSFSIISYGSFLAFIWLKSIDLIVQINMKSRGPVWCWISFSCWFFVLFLIELLWRLSNSVRRPRIEIWSNKLWRKERTWIFY